MMSFGGRYGMLGYGDVKFIASIDVICWNDKLLL